MKKFSLITTIIFALTGCCLAGFGGRGWKNNPNMKPVIDAVCNVNERPDETQWTNLLNCTQYNKRSDPRREKFAETKKEIFANCSAIADDVPEALKTSNEEQMKIIFTLCSQEFEECKRNSWKQLRKHWKNHQRGDQSNDRSVDQSNDQSGDQSNDQSVDQSNDQSGDQSNGRSGDQSNDQSSDQSNDRSSDQSVDHSGDQSADKSDDQQNPEQRKKHHRGGRKHFDEKIVIIRSIF